MSEKQLVLVLGMHRSGTSLVTSLIEANGFSCGKYPMKPSKDILRALLVFFSMAGVINT